MILSVSRRTDIPNYYSEWFLNRIKEGYVYARNPMNAHQISRISLSPSVVDGIVFWTKNPAGMLGRLEELRAYPYYVQFTLTGYGRDVEPGLPDKRTVLIPAFRELAEKAGAGRVVWRYDPIFISDRYTAAYHRKAFAEIAAALAGYTRRVVVSFLDCYVKTRRNTAALRISHDSEKEAFALAGELAATARRRGMETVSCAEPYDLQDMGIKPGSCIDKALLETVTGCRLAGGKDKNQRAACGCMESVDVGNYHTCLTGCRYCYANHSIEAARENAKAYDPHSALLCGRIGPDDRVTERKVKSLKDMQTAVNFAMD